MLSYLCGEFALKYFAHAKLSNQTLFYENIIPYIYFFVKNLIKFKNNIIPTSAKVKKKS